MGWKTPADPVNVNFHSRLTAAESAALEAVIAKWAEKQRALGPGASATQVAWFRALVRRLAAEEGIPVNDPPAPAVPPKKRR